MKKPALGSPDDPRLLQSMKEVVEIVTGRRGVKVKSLAANATTLQIIAKINELILLLQE